MLQMMAMTLAPSDVTAEEIAEGLDAIASVQTGGHFFGAPHTLSRYETAFYPPLVSDWQSYESWELAGAKTADERATAVWQAALDRYEQPPLGQDVRERLDAYVAERRVILRDADI